MGRKKMILDLDTGIDDAMAIAYALASEEIDLIGIVGSYGNLQMLDGVQNSLNLLSLLGQPNIPVYLGEKHSMTTQTFNTMQISQEIHGMNGIGDITIPKSDQSPHPGSGIDFIIDSAKKFQSDLIIVPTGPLTNLALAIKQSPEIETLIGKVVLMGGALTIPGNVTPVAEANINQDPEAANEVFQSKLTITMVGLDVTLKTLLTKKETQEWRQLNSTSSRAFADIVDYYIEAYANLKTNLGGCALHDPLAVAVAIDPSLVTTLPINMKVDTKSPFSGRTIGDERRLNSNEATTDVAVAVETERFLSIFMTKLSTLFSKN
ncbi:nucleoside hydrolase [Dellaglioa algida]|uniref:Inosine-uridine preferring nucleoside hydrolase n=1 Tax=Dellaglioa algida DSM 15638 TaxID=1423719 RepID=A0A0R1HKD0_9LACO|nr:nucleoside hydrolase [Dellaglioa algida]KRK46664.1 inosine-uridine preferring nucleoside hydrolase [Dellaglioa algida DSM 15638]MDK1732419.1 nucleoside hydrolase [Dellaglioa algida]MDK1734192.1 nucleoside hydrolase [Dellaglioa algida]